MTALWNLITGSGVLEWIIGLAAAAGLTIWGMIHKGRADRLKRENKDLKGYVDTRKKLDHIDTPADRDSAAQRLREANAKLARRGKR